MMLTENLTAHQLHQELINITDENHNCLYPLDFCEKAVPLVNEINALKKEKNACILAHSYVTADIIYGVSDFTGDSYELSKKAKGSKADKIVFAGVKFMGETAKLLCPDKDILMPAQDPGCTLADAVTGEQVLKLKQENPDYTFVCYINTTAAVKAACDVCVTSSNIYKVVEKIPNRNIFFVPDKLMALNLIEYLKKNKIDKSVKFLEGTCYVHEEYGLERILETRATHPNVKVLCHPECQVAVCQACDYVGSTSQILNYVKNCEAKEYLILTDSGISARIQHDYPDKKIIGTSLTCKYMKSNTLSDILRVLKNPGLEDFVHVAPNIREKALACINAMFTYTE